MKDNEVKVEVTLTEGFEKRFTEACLQQLCRRQENIKPEMPEESEKKTA